MELDDKILSFIKRHHVMTLATVGADGQPWCAHIFYAWQAGKQGEPVGGEGFVFTSDVATRHGAEMVAGAHVAAGIALETRIVGRVRGLQIEGKVRRPEGTELDKARRTYLKRFPYAAAAPDLMLWLLEPTHMKLTDNTLGFGKKLVWRVESGSNS